MALKLVPKRDIMDIVVATIGNRLNQSGKSEVVLYDVTMVGDLKTVTSSLVSAVKRYNENVVPVSEGSVEVSTSLLPHGTTYALHMVALDNVEADVLAALEGAEFLDAGEVSSTVAPMNDAEIEDAVAQAMEVFYHAEASCGGDALILAANFHHNLSDEVASPVNYERFISNFTDSAGEYCIAMNGDDLLLQHLEPVLLTPVADELHSLKLRGVTNDGTDAA